MMNAAEADFLAALDLQLDQYVRCDQSGCRRVAAFQMIYTCAGPSGVYCEVHSHIVEDLIQSWAEQEAEWSCPKHGVTHGILEAVHLERIGC